MPSDSGRERQRKKEKEEMKKGGRARMRTDVQRISVKNKLKYLGGLPGVQKCAKSALIISAQIATLLDSQYVVTTG